MKWVVSTLLFTSSLTDSNEVVVVPPETAAALPSWGVQVLSIIAGFVAFVLTLRGLHWFLAGLVDREYLDRLPPRLVRAMENWWRQTSETPAPQLAQREAAEVVSRVKTLLHNDGHPKSLAVAASFLLTTCAFLLGYAIFVVATLAHLRIQVFAGSAVPSAVPKPVEPSQLLLGWMPVLIPLAAYAWLLTRTMARPDDRKRLLYRYAAWYLALLFGLESARQGVSLITQEPTRSLLYVIGSLACVALYAWSATSYTGGMRKDRPYALGVLVRTLLVVCALALMTMITWRPSEGVPWPIVWSSQSVLVYGANYAFDMLTILASLYVFERMAAGGTLSNIVWLVGNIALAGFLAVGVYVVVGLGLFVPLQVGSLSSFRIDNEVLVGLAKEVLAEFSVLNLGLILFALTTFIPITAYGMMTVPRYVGRLVLMVAGRWGAALFVKPPSDKKTSAYLTLVGIALAISFVSGYLAWLGAIMTLGGSR